MGSTTTWSDEELRKKIGQLFIVGFHDQTPNEHIKTLVRDHHVGAIVYFQRNVASASQLYTLTKDLQNLAKESGHTHPLFIGIDQENGLVTRIKSHITPQLPGSMALGATGDAQCAYDVASATAEMLSFFGINTNYAPIADVNNEPNNPVIGVRSPSDDPDIVGKFASVQAKGCRKHGVVSCAKHFPGHGDTAVDSHYGLPVIKKSKTQLDECELLPFRRVASEGIESIMTAHIALPYLEEGPGGQPLPASLSSKAVNMLRNEMGYEGIILSDCLEMDGVRATYGTEKGAVMAFKAGTDVVMICHTLSSQVGAIEELVKAFKAGEISQSAIETSVNRVLKVKEKYLSWESAQKADFEKLKAINAANEKLAKEVYAKNTTMPRSESGVLPLSKDANVMFLSPGIAPKHSGVVNSGDQKTRVPYTPSEFFDVLAKHCPNISEIRFHDDEDLTEEMLQKIKAADAVILATRNARLAPYQKEMGLKLAEMVGKKLITIATCDPYDFLLDSPSIKTYITTYEPTVAAFESAANIIFGVTKPRGSLPVLNPKAKHEVKDYAAERDSKQVSSLWNAVLPTWPIAEERLTNLLSASSGHHLVTYSQGELVGACLSFKANEESAKIAAVIVSPASQGKGIGAALIGEARRHYQKSMPSLKSVSIGSTFPRFWPGLPIDMSQEVKDWFVHRGFRKISEPASQDFYRDITGFTAPKAVMERAKAAGLTFAPWSKKTEEECIAKQWKNFGNNKDWVGAYEALAARNMFDQVMVAFDSAGAQVGWTLMLSPSNPIMEGFAFPPVFGPKVGLIACVGVDAEIRKGGIGIALLCKAIENMQSRGIEGIFIDWVVLRGFYEKLGFEVWKEYERFEW